MELPEYIEKCTVCKGTGEYEQTYNEGCGGGMTKMVGPCDWCKHPKFFMRGIGYSMKDRSEMPMSVINQLSTAGIITAKKSPYSDHYS